MDFPETADIETSSAAYAARFAGAAGQWMLKVQERGVLNLLGNCNGQRIVEPGGGHAQLTRAMLSAGGQVTVLGSTAACAERLASLKDNPGFKFEVGNLIELPFADREFDSVVSVRFVSHCTRWPEFVADVCRVARHSVILDYPPRASFNFFAEGLFGLKKYLEGNTRRYSVFSDREIEDSFNAHGFVLERRIRQFFLPMVLHRTLKCPAVSAMLESLAGILGLRKLFGSPVLVKMVRRKEQ